MIKGTRSGKLFIVGLGTKPNKDLWNVGTHGDRV